MKREVDYHETITNGEAGKQMKKTGWRGPSFSPSRRLCEEERCGSGFPVTGPGQASRERMVRGRVICSTKAHSRGMSVAGARGRGSGIRFFPYALHPYRSRGDQARL